MKAVFYLTVNNRGSVRVTKTQPSLDWNEVSILLNLNIPDQVFRKPILQADITIPEEVVANSPINADVANNVALAIEQATGLKFAITVEEKKEETNPQALA